MKKHLGQTPSVREYTERLAPVATASCAIDPALYEEYGVKRGLRDKNGKGVLAGLTNISDIISSKEIGGETVPCEGELYYRGYDINSLIGGILKDNRFGFEEIAYLLLMGNLPDKAQLAEFKSVLSRLGTLPTNFVRDVVMKAPSGDMMNTLARSVLTLASYDANAASLDYANVLRQCLALISVFPMLAVYGYHAYNHYVCNDSFYIHRPDHSLSMAENILRMLRPDCKYSDLEAKVLDIALILHMEHGGGNNSTFTTRVVTSSGADTYSVIAAALSSLKGPKHGGANIKVVEMMADLKKHVRDKSDEEEISAYLLSLLRLMQPKLLLPATTALGTILPDGRERGLAAGANVVMPNLSPLSVRKKYALYDGKLCTGEEAAQCIGCLSRRVASVGCRIVTARGDIIR